MIERHYSLTQAAKVIGCNRATLLGWLDEDGFDMPRLQRGQHFLIPVSILEAVMDRRSAKPTLVSTQKKAS